MDVRHARRIYIGTTAERTALALTLSSTFYGARFFDTDTGLEYFWDGSAWVTGGGATEFNQVILYPYDHSSSQIFAASSAGLTAALVAAAAAAGAIYVPAGLYSGDFVLPTDTVLFGAMGESEVTRLSGQVTMVSGCGLNNMYISHTDSDVTAVNSILVTGNGTTVYVNNCYLYCSNSNGVSGDGNGVNIAGLGSLAYVRNTIFRPRSTSGNAYAVYIASPASSAVYMHDCILREGLIVNSTASAYTRIVNVYSTDLDSIVNNKTLESAGIRQPIVSKSGAYTVTVLDHTILGDASGGDFTLTLPTLATAYDSVTEVGLILNIKTISTGNLTVDGNGAETIDGAASQILSVQYEAITIQAGPTEWSIL